jgi:hypothetical protein
MMDLNSVPLFQSFINLELGTNELSPCISAERLGALNGSTDGTVDDELGKNTESTRNTKENSVVVLLSQAVVLEEDTRVLQRNPVS